MSTEQAAVACLFVSEMDKHSGLSKECWQAARLFLRIASAAFITNPAVPEITKWTASFGTG